ncbi:hypothetical protein ABZP36_008079, partial [Zizania latifolia]
VPHYRTAPYLSSHRALSQAAGAGSFGLAWPACRSCRAATAGCRPPALAAASSPSNGLKLLHQPCAEVSM